MLPQGVAFAIIAGLPPIYGLYSAMVLPVIAGLFGSSRHLISGPTTAISIVVFSSIAGLAEPSSSEFIQLALLLTLFAGMFQLIFGLVRLGALINFVSHTVIIGFTTGAAILIFTSQLNSLLGLSKPAGISFFEGWSYLFSNLNQFNSIAAIVGTSTLVIAVILKKINRRLPNLLIAMVLGSFINVFLGGIESGVLVVGELPKGLPSFTMPSFSDGGIQQILPSALAIALLGLIEAVAIARSISMKSGQLLDSNQEFIGQGLSNIIGSFFSSYAGSGSFTRSGINYESGAKTPLSAIAAALFLGLILLLVSPWAAYLPMPVMAGIIIVVAYNLVNIKHMMTIFKSSKRESSVLLITLFSTLILDLEYAIYLGVIFSLVFYLQATSKPRLVKIAPNPEDNRRRFLNTKKFKLDECPQLLIIRIEGSLFFGAISHIDSKFREYHNGTETNLIIVGNGINLIDTSGAEFLIRESEFWNSKGGGLFISGLKLRARKGLKKNGVYKAIGENHIFDNKETAIDYVYNKLDKAICETCELRIYRECNN